jgi:hypothetical protein
VSDASLEDFHLAAGKLLQNSSTNELFLAKVFEILSGTSARIAHATFYSLDSLNGKANLLRRVAEVAATETESDCINRLIDAAKKSNAQRNSVAHSLLVFDAPDLKSGMRIFSLKAQRFDVISKASLAARVATSSEAMNEGQAALKEFCDGRGLSALLDVTYLDP